MLKKGLRWLRQNAAALSALAATFTVIGGVIGYALGLFWPGLAATDHARGYREGKRIAACENRAARAEADLELQQDYYQILAEWCGKTPEERHKEIIKRLRDGTF